MLTVNSNARVHSAIAPLNGEARLSASQTSQLLAGQVVRLLENNGDWWKVRGADLYEGWMHVGYIELSNDDEHNWHFSLGATVRSADGDTRTLPFGARFSNDWKVISGESLTANAIAERFARASSSLVDTAVTFFAGASYLWGGVTPWGCDCSGLVQAVYALHGIQLPRDAWQQALVGEQVPITTLDAGDIVNDFFPGDLLFFSDRADKRITHVGLAMADNHFVHSGVRRGGVRVENLMSDEAYVQQLRANFISARRFSFNR
ncbi:MAG: SH3 domain-containing C40 family peptidase [Gemmatimonadaceae bacterium]